MRLKVTFPLDSCVQTISHEIAKTTLSVELSRLRGETRISENGEWTPTMSVLLFLSARFTLSRAPWVIRIYERNSRKSDGDDVIHHPPVDCAIFGMRLVCVTLLFNARGTPARMRLWPPNSLVTYLHTREKNDFKIPQLAFYRKKKN